MSRDNEPKKSRLTKQQAQKVRELMEDGGYSREEAKAWVLTMRWMYSVLVRAYYEGMSRDNEPKKSRLTKQQAQKVRELMEDGGYSREEAKAWVLTFGGDQ